MKSVYLLSILTVTFLITGCGDSKQSTAEGESAPPPKSMVEEEADPMENKGIGPVSSITFDDEVNAELASQGEQIYTQMCTVCHKIEEDFIGPSPKGIYNRRSPEWVANMILNPMEMVEKDPIAKQLLIDYNGAPMTNQNLSKDQTRAILEYFRTL